MRPLLMCLLVCVVSFGCARLSVEVDILDPIALDEAALHRLFNEVAKATPETVAKEVELLRRRHSSTNKKLAEIYRDFAGKQSNERLKEILKSSADSVENSAEKGGPLIPLYEKLEKTIRRKPTAARI